MFVIKAKNAVDYGIATAILVDCNVHVRMEFEGKETLMVVTEQLPTMPCRFDDLQECVDELRRCEMAFQASFHQVGNLCPVCRAEIERTGEGSSVCGHLTFTTAI